MTAEETLGIFFITFEGIAAIVLLVLYLLDRKIVKAYQEHIKMQNEFNDETLRYCLIHILSEAVKSEDFECAKKCKELLDKLPKTELTNH